MRLPPPPQCAFPGCDEFPLHRHHVTYEPEVIKYLCVAHHEEITIINGIQGRKYRTQLSNKHRWWIWFQWIQGRLKPRRTQKAMEYIEEMRRTPEHFVRPIQPEPVTINRDAQIPKTKTNRKRKGRTKQSAEQKHKRTKKLKLTRRKRTTTAASKRPIR